MTLMTWCGVLGVGWVVIACTSAIVWERTAAAQTVVETQTGADEPPRHPTQREVSNQEMRKV